VRRGTGGCEGKVNLYLEGGEDGVGFADYADDHGTLFDGFLCILDLEDTALW